MNAPTKYILIVPDGMADEPVESLNGKTPLEVARTPNMDYLAQHGISGLVKTIPEGMSPGSDIGNMALLGYDPRKWHTGRAPIEAANLNISLAEDEIIFRCNLVTIFDDTMTDYSADHISTESASELINALNDKIQSDVLQFFAGKSYRHLMRMKVKNPTDYNRELKTTPPHDILGQKITSYLPSGHDQKLLRELMSDAKTILDQHPLNQSRQAQGKNPANAIWLWGQGTIPDLPSFQKKFGISGGIISAVDLVNGIGRLAGLEIINVPGITGYYDTNYAGKAQYAIESLKKNDFVYVHIEAPDEAGHNGDVNAKIEAIEKIDQLIVGPILNHYKNINNVRILVLPDHPTPVALRTHTADPVCFVMYGQDINSEGLNEFCERTTQEKGLKFKSGEELLDYFILKPPAK